MLEHSAGEVDLCRSIEHQPVRDLEDVGSGLTQLNSRPSWGYVTRCRGRLFPPLCFGADRT